MPQFMWTERPLSRETTANPPSVTLRYRASGPGCEDEQYVQAYALNATPAIYGTIWGNLFRDDVKLTSRGYLLWDVDIPYVKAASPPRGSWTWSYDTTGGSFHIKASKNTVAKFGTTRNYGQLIGVNGDGPKMDVEGADVIIPSLKINVTFKQPQGVVTLDYASFLADITGTVNSTVMLRRQPGEVLFLGGSGQNGSDVETEANYQFAVSRNLQGLVIGAITAIQKDGWDVSWIRWKDSVDAANPVKQPEGVYIERVYDRYDLAGALGFGG